MINIRETNFFDMESTEVVNIIYKHLGPLKRMFKLTNVGAYGPDSFTLMSNLELKNLRIISSFIYSPKFDKFNFYSILYINYNTVSASSFVSGNIFQDAKKQSEQIQNRFKELSVKHFGSSLDFDSERADRSLGREGRSWFEVEIKNERIIKNCVSFIKEADKFVKGLDKRTAIGRKRL